MSFTLKITTFPNFRTARGQEIEIDLRNFLGESHRVVLEKTQATFCAATFTNQHRKNENIKKVTALIYDFDSVPLRSFDRVSQLLRQMKFCAYTTFSHDPQKTNSENWRLILFLNRPLDRHEYHRVMKHVGRELDLKFDVQASAAAQCFLVPSTTTERFKSSRILFNSGRSLDVDLTLSLAKPERSFEFKLAPNSLKSEVDFDSEFLQYLRSNCAVIDQLFFLITQGLPSHAVRFCFTQLCLSLGFSQEEILSFFAKRPDFDEKISRYQIYSITKGLRVPTCYSLSRRLGFCDGNCSIKSNLKIYGPTQINDKRKIS